MKTVSITNRLSWVKKQQHVTVVTYYRGHHSGSLKQMHCLSV